ncbi:MAG: 16S rRNA (cytidine(1402)-2'-O)-methyltransferase [Patescibacteria group bacterium]|nr:16S rRNA (cytidine(1402)-2'-O)-methyltransferase [Patescibacteria group bacterium]
MFKLYLLPTPIGNLKDITLRTIEILRELNFLFCEDIKRAKILLNHYQIEEKKLILYNSYNEKKKIPKILDILKKENIGLLVSAGMPAISDPGYKLIKECLKHNIEIEVLPGPSAFLTSLIGSGLPPDRFIFLGFLPKKGLKSFINNYFKDGLTIIFYESPYRLIKTLKLISETFPSVYVVIAREISKIYEEYLRGDIKEIIKNLEGKKIKGEITVILRINFKYQ